MVKKSMIDTHSLLRERFRKLILRFAIENKVPVNEVYYQLYGAFIKERKTPWLFEEIKHQNSLLDYFDSIGLLRELVDFTIGFLKDISNRMNDDNSV
jgi:hypothetical protein